MSKDKKAPPLKLHGSIKNTKWMHVLGALLVTAGVCSVISDLAALHAQSAFFIDKLQPDFFTLAAPVSVATSLEWKAIDETINPQVSSDDLLHLNFLEAACQAETDTVLPSTFGAPSTTSGKLFPSSKSSNLLVHPGDPRLLDQLRQCPDVDIYLPASNRGPAECAAIAGPLKYLRSRLLPKWAMEAKMYDIQTKTLLTYVDVCPLTPMVFLSPGHVLEMVQESSWPKDKPVYLMAPTMDGNLSSRAILGNFTRSVLERTDVVLCRTVRCDRDIKHFLIRQSTIGEKSRIKNTRVLYTSQVTSNPVNFAQRMRQDDADSYRRNVADFAYARFAHTTWNLSSKTTQDVLSCWKSHSVQLPPLDVYLLRALYEKKPHNGSRYYKSFPSINNEKKVKLLDAVNFAKQFGQAAFFICPTAGDDCLDLARASGGVIVTADAYPMNEFISNPAQGVTFPTMQSYPLLQTEYRSLVPDDALLLPPPAPHYRSLDLCAAVLSIKSSFSLDQLRNISRHTSRRFHEDAKVFILSMLELRAFTNEIRTHKARQDDEELVQSLRHS